MAVLRVVLDRGYHGGTSLDVRSTSNSDRVFSGLATVAMGQERHFGRVDYVRVAPYSDR
jgi:hypothetical protein